MKSIKKNSVVLFAIVTIVNCGGCVFGLLAEDLFATINCTYWQMVHTVVFFCVNKVFEN